MFSDLEGEGGSTTILNQLKVLELANNQEGVEKKKQFNYKNVINKTYNTGKHKIRVDESFVSGVSYQKKNVCTIF